MVRYLLFMGLVTYCLAVALSRNSRGLLPLPSDRIVGGEQTSIASFPHQVSLRYFSWHRCGGSLIRSNVIVTAAHCVDGIPLVNLAVGAGSSDVTQYDTISKLKNVIVHEKYDDWTLDFDVALVVLLNGFDFSKNVQPIALARADEELRPGTRVVVSGWGSIHENGAEPDILRYVAIHVISSHECSSSYSAWGAITENMMCAGASGGGKDACQGDSGGPLIVSGKLFGIVSWGIGCARPEYPGVYTKVAAVRSWIDNNV